MKKLIALLLLLPALNSAAPATDIDRHFLLSSILALHEADHDRTQALVGSFIGGFRSGLMTGITIYSALNGKNKADSNTLDCIFEDDPSIVYARLIFDAQTNPDMSLLDWIQKHYLSKCSAQIQDSFDYVNEDHE